MEKLVPECRVTELREGSTVKIYYDEDCTKFKGYASLVSEVGERKTFIPDQQDSIRDHEKVYVRQKWTVKFMPYHALPPFTDERERYEQRFVENRKVSVYLYEYLGTWKELRGSIIEEREQDED